MLVFRGFGAPGKLSGGQFSAENGLAGPGTGGGALNKLFAKCINFALHAAIIPNLGASFVFLLFCLLPHGDIKRLQYFGFTNHEC